MKIREELQGDKKAIFSVVLDDGEIPAVEFLRQLKQSDLGSHKKMVYRYKRHAANGPTANKQHERHIASHGNLWEFKTPQGDRLLYFNHPDGLVVLTNGFHKGDPVNQQYDRAVEYRDQILQQWKDENAATN